MNQTLEYLKYIDENNIYLEDYQIATKIKELSGSTQLIGNELLEFLAFSYVSNPTNDNSNWNISYGPVFVGTNKNGSLYEFPAKETINIDALIYYKKRANVVKNPLLKYRYSDLVIEFQKILNEKLNINFYHFVIDSLIELCDKSNLEGIVLIQKLIRAFNLAKTTSDITRLNKLKITSIKLEQKIGDDNKPGLYGFTLKLFQIKNTLLSKKELKEQILIQNDRLERLLKSKNAWGARSSIKLLLEYYSKDQKNCDEIMKLLQKLYNVYKTSKDSNDHPIKVLHYLEDIKNIANNYSYCKKSVAFGNKIQQEIFEYNPEWNKHLQEVSVKFDIDNAKIDTWIKSIFGENYSYRIEQIVPKIVVNFLQKVNTVEIQLDDLQTKYPLQYLVSRDIIGNRGKIIAETDKIDRSDFIQLYSQNLYMHDYFLDIVIQKFINKFSKKDIKNEIVKCFLIYEIDYPYLDRIIENLFGNNYIETCALIIPFIEKLIRNLCELNHDSIYKTDNDLGGYKYKILHELLSFESFKLVFMPLGGEDVVNYLKISLTSKIGLNLRNDFCHGENLNQLNKYTANRLFHILLLLSLVRKDKVYKDKNN